VEFLSFVQDRNRMHVGLFCYWQLLQSCLGLI
jgi:hypothetical protein